MSAPEYRVQWSDHHGPPLRTETFATEQAAHEAFYAKREEPRVALDVMGCDHTGAPTWITLYRLTRVAPLWSDARGRVAA